MLVTWRSGRPVITSLSMPSTAAHVVGIFIGIFDLGFFDGSPSMARDDRYVGDINDYRRKYALLGASAMREKARCWLHGGKSTGPRTNAGADPDRFVGISQEIEVALHARRQAIIDQMRQAPSKLERATRAAAKAV